MTIFNIVFGIWAFSLLLSAIAYAEPTLEIESSKAAYAMKFCLLGLFIMAIISIFIN